MKNKITEAKGTFKYNIKHTTDVGEVEVAISNSMGFREDKVPIELAMAAAKRVAEQTGKDNSEIDVVLIGKIETS